jgi:plasmid stabilization system protein ParE
MKVYEVIFSPSAQSHLINLFHYIKDASASVGVSSKYIDAVIDYCESFSTFPHRGIKRDDLSLGLRIVNYKKTCVIAIQVTDDKVFIHGVFYGGQDYEAYDWNDRTEAGFDH